MLMTERDGAIIFCRILAPHQGPPPPPLTPQYLTILMTERGGESFIVFWCPPPNAPSPDATVLHYLNDRERGAIIFCRILATPNAPPPLPRRHNT